MSTLQQISITFDPVEDRLLLRITTGKPSDLDEYRIWLTRRLVQGILKLLDRSITAEIMMDPLIQQDSAGALQEFQQASALAKADFATPFSAAAARTPMGPDPMLITKIQIHKRPGGHLLTLQTAKGQIKLTLNAFLIYSFRKLLADQILKTQWNLPPGMDPGKTGFLVEVPRTIN
jgi:hypothetical protein